MAKERPQEDIKITFPNCGCVVTFFWRSGFNTARMKACAVHSHKNAKLIRDNIIDCARREKDELLAKFRNTPQTAFLDLLLAAMMSACKENKGTQLKTTITPDEQQPPMAVRIIVVPEDGLVEATAEVCQNAVGEALAKGEVTAYNTGEGSIRIVVMPEKMEHNWPQNAPLGTDPTTLN